MLAARTFLVRGLLAGFIAGVVTFGVAFLVGEPPVANAIAFEESQSAATENAGQEHAAANTAGGAVADGAEHSHGEEEELVSRANQSTWGLATATVLFGTALGGIIALVSAFAVGRLGRLSSRATIALVAGIGFVSVYLVPYLEYPPNPPAVGRPDTIVDRSALYFIMVAVSLVAAVIAVIVAKRLSSSMGGWNAVVVAFVGYLVIIVVTAWLLSIIDEVPADFSADLLWRFRMASVAVQATVYTVTGLLLAGMIHSALQKATAPDAAADLVRAGTSA